LLEGFFDGKLLILEKLQLTVEVIKKTTLKSIVF